LRDPLDIMKKVEEEHVL